MNNILRSALISIFSLGYSVGVDAQVDVSSFNNSHSGLAASNLLPSYLGDGFKKIEITTFNPYVHLGSNFTNASNLKAYLNEDTYRDALINSTLSDLREENNIQAGLRLSILSLGLNLNNKNGKSGFSIGAGANEVVEANVLFNKEVYLLAYRGNKQFAGQTVNLAPRVNALAYMEYYISGAANLTIPGTDFLIKPAVRLRYLIGQASIYTQHQSELSMFTEQDGRYLDIRSKYEVHSSTAVDTLKLGEDDFTFDQSTFQAGVGKGLGMDFGLRIEPMENLSINLGLSDVGSINFTKNTSTLYSDTGFRYEGQSFRFTDEFDKFSVDSFAAVLNPKYHYDAFRVPLPTKFLLTAHYGVGKVEKNNQSFYRSTLSLVYVQGMSNYFSATTTPWVILGYNRNFNTILNAGINAGLGGLYRANVGASLSVKAGFFRIGVSSNNLLPLFAGTSGRGTDLAILIGFGR